MKLKVLVWILGLFAIVGLTLASFSAPYVVQIDPSLEQEKVTFNAPFTVHFSHLMNRSSTQAAFEVFPKIDGSFEWKDGRTLEFHPEDELKIGDEYRIAIKSSARSLWLKEVGLDTSLSYVVTGPPYLLYAHPADGSLINKDTPVTLMFDRPMAFAEISDSDLIQAEPKVKAFIRYMGQSAFQLIPEKLPGNEDLKLKIPAGLLSLDGGKTEEAYELTLRTPKLEVDLATPASGAEEVDELAPIEIRFNGFVDLSDIKPGLNALLYPSNDLDAGQTPKMDGFFNTEVVHAVDGEGNKKEDTLIFTPTFPYQEDTSYRFVLKAANELGLKEDYEMSFHTGEKPEGAEEKVVEETVVTTTETLAKMRFATDNFLDFFIIGENPRLELAEVLKEPFYLSVCAIPSSQYMRVNSRQGWDNFSCENDAKLVDPIDTPFGKTLNLAEFFKDEWEHGVYYVSLETEEEKLDRVFFIKDASLYVKKSSSDLMVWATDVKSGEVIPNMDIEVFSFTGDLLETGTTDENGYLLIDRGFSDTVYVRGKKGVDAEEYFAIVSSQWNPENELKAITPPEILVKTNVNQLMPGQELEVKGVWRSPQAHLLGFPENKQVTVSLQDQSHNLLVEKRTALRRNGSFDATLRLPDELIDGLYLLNIADINNQSLIDAKLIEVQERPSSVELEWVKADSHQAGGQAPAYIVSARFKNGLPAAGIKGSYKLFSQPYSQGHQDGAIHFGFKPLEGVCQENCHERTLVFEGDLEFDEKGKASLLLTNDKEGFLPAGHEYDLELEAGLSKSDSAVIAKSFVVHQGEFDLGLGLKHALVALGQPIELSVIALNHENESLEGEKVLISLINEEGDEVFSENLSTNRAPASLSISASSKIKEGVYLLRAEAQDEKRNKIRAEKKVHVYSELGDALEGKLLVAADQAQYFVGGRAHLLISEPEATEERPVPVVVSYERDGIIDHEFHQLKTPITRVAVPIEEEMMPHFKVKVTRFHRGLDPYYSFDETSILVGDDETKILVDFELDPPTPKPGEELTLNISTTDFQGLPLASVVTLNVLEAEVEASNDPLSFFYEPAPQNISFVPGPASIYFDPLVTTDGAGKASVTLTVPEGTENLGFELTATKDQMRFGQLARNFRTSHRLEIRPVMPSFVTPGDQTTLGALIQNVSKESVSTRVEILSSELAIQGDGSRNISLEPGQQTEIQFKVFINPDTTGNFVNLKLRSGEDLREISLPVKHLMAHKDLASSTLISDLWSGRVTSSNKAHPNTGNVKLITSGSPLVLSHVYHSGFENYPYSSTEILARKIIALASQVEPKNETALSQIRALVSQLLKRADDEGAYRYWKERESSPRLTALALVAYKKAVEAGVHIDSILLNRTFNYLLAALDTEGLNQDSAALILWALGLHDNLDTGKTLAIFAERDSMSLVGKSHLLMNLSQLMRAGQRSVLPVRDRLKSEIVDQITISDNYASVEQSLKLSTLALFTLVEVNSENPLIGSLISYILENEINLLDRFDPELATWTILALEEIKEQFEEETNYIAQAKLGGELVVDESVTSKTVLEVHETLAQTPSQEFGFADLFVKKEGEGELYFDAHQFSFLDPALVEPVEDGLLLVRTLFEQEEDGELIPATNFRKSKQYVSRLEFIVPEDLEFVALTEFIPAGFRLDIDSKFFESTVFDSQETGDEFVRFYASHLPAGVYQLELTFEAVLPGSYKHLPARLQPMREPEKWSQTGGSMIQILE